MTAATSREKPLFAHVPEGAPTDTWDGHTTEEKYARIEQYIGVHGKLMAAMGAERPA